MRILEGVGKNRARRKGALKSDGQAECDSPQSQQRLYARRLKDLLNASCRSTLLRLGTVEIKAAEKIF